MSSLHDQKLESGGDPPVVNEGSSRRRLLPENNVLHEQAYLCSSSTDLLARARQALPRSSSAGPLVEQQYPLASDSDDVDVIVWPDSDSELDVSCDAKVGDAPHVYLLRVRPVFPLGSFPLAGPRRQNRRASPTCQ